MKQTPIQKMAIFTDIHFGSKLNSESHNQDCLNFVKWFIKDAMKHKVDAIVFSGDWYENRRAINVATMVYSEEALTLLNDCGLPVFFIVGNHDLYHRNTRDIHSLGITKLLSNFILVVEPEVIENGKHDFLLVPYLFADEYKSLKKYNKVNTWIGHFEFNGFDLGGGQVMRGAAEPKQFNKPNMILSGHFHKRDTFNNVTYIGSAFPTTFMAAGCNTSGYAICDFEKLEFIDWPDTPTYHRINLSDLIDGTVEIEEGARVECMADVTVSYSESIKLKKKFAESLATREFNLVEVSNADALENDEEILVEEEDKNASTHDLIAGMLLKVESDNISTDHLSKIYRDLEV